MWQTREPIRATQENTYSERFRDEGIALVICRFCVPKSEQAGDRSSPPETNAQRAEHTKSPTTPS